MVENHSVLCGSGQLSFHPDMKLNKVIILKIFSVPKMVVFLHLTWFLPIISKCCEIIQNKKGSYRYATFTSIILHLCLNCQLLQLNLPTFTVSITNGISFVLGDISFIDTKNTCVFHFSVCMIRIQVSYKIQLN